MTSNVLTAYRGTVVHALRDPLHDPAGIEIFEDGLLCVADGRVRYLGSAESVARQLPSGVRTVDFTGRYIVPGFVDTHIHYPQVDVIDSFGEQLLDWLKHYTFPAERRFDDPEWASETAAFFIDELLRNGTTTAMVFPTVHPVSVDAIFEAARFRGMRLISGKVLMDRHCPDYLQDTAETGYRASRALIEKWHGQERLSYAITPRFAPTSSDEQLAKAGQLAAEYPDVYIQSHVAENPEEVAWVAKLFPDRRSYLDVYDHFGLLRERSVYAHCIHLDGDDRRRMAESGAAASFCPTSNLFLGSGLFDMEQADAHGIRVGMGTDVGGGTSFSMLQTLNEAYKVMQMSGQVLSPARAFYLATLGGARSLYLDDRIGNLSPGKEADFVVLNPEATPLMSRRMNAAEGVLEAIFAFMVLGDDRCISEVFLAGSAR